MPRFPQHPYDEDEDETHFCLYETDPSDPHQPTSWCSRTHPRMIKQYIRIICSRIEILTPYLRKRRN